MKPRKSPCGPNKKGVSEKNLSLDGFLGVPVQLWHRKCIFLCCDSRSLPVS